MDRARCHAREGAAGPIDAELAAAVLEALPDPTAVVDRDGVIVAINDAWRRFAQENGGSVMSTGAGASYLDVCTRSARGGCLEAARVAAGLRAVLAQERAAAEVVEYPCATPSVRRWFMVRIHRLAGDDEGAVVSHVDITLRKLAEEALTHDAFHDPLSGLANRRMLEQRLSTALAMGTEQLPSGVGVLYVDLDGFKAVNDSVGHAVGDEVLLAVGQRLVGLVRSGDTAARVGGDEFVVVAVGVDRAGLAALVGRVDAALAEPHTVGGRALVVRGSVGAHLARPGDVPADALRLADSAMYAVKLARRAQVTSQAGS